MFEVKLINAEMTLEIRHKILRPTYKTPEDCRDETDDDKNTFHVGGFSNGQLVSIVSFCIDKHPDFPHKVQYRLKSMASLEDFRKMGAGKAVVEYGEEVLKNRGANFLWCRGRTSVQDYYVRLGFKAHGEVFYYEPSGYHIIMYKEL